MSMRRAVKGARMSIYLGNAERNLINEAADTLERSSSWIIARLVTTYLADLMKSQAPASPNA